MLIVAICLEIMVDNQKNADEVSSDITQTFVQQILLLPFAEVTK